MRRSFWPLVFFSTSILRAVTSAPLTVDNPGPTLGATCSSYVQPARMYAVDVATGNTLKCSGVYPANGVWQASDLPSCTSNPPSSVACSVNTVAKACKRTDAAEIWGCAGTGGFMVNMSGGGGSPAGFTGDVQVKNSGALGTAPGLKAHVDSGNLETTLLNGEAMAYKYATGGDGSSGTPWTGWETNALIALSTGIPLHFSGGDYATPDFQVAVALSNVPSKINITGDGSATTRIRITGGTGRFRIYGTGAGTRVLLNVRLSGISVVAGVNNTSAGLVSLENLDLGSSVDDLFVDTTSSFSTSVGLLILNSEHVTFGGVAVRGWSATSGAAGNIGTCAKLSTDDGIQRGNISFDNLNVSYCTTGLLASTSGGSLNNIRFGTFKAVNGTTVNGTIGISLASNVEQVTFSDVHVERFADGLIANNIEGVTITGSLWSEIHNVANGAGVALTLTNGDGATITTPRFSNVFQGISLTGTQTRTVITRGAVLNISSNVLYFDTSTGANFFFDRLTDITSDNLGANECRMIANGWICGGATRDVFQTTLTVTDPTGDRQIVLPNASGTVALLDSALTPVTLEIPHSALASRPATCSVGRIYQVTDASSSQQVYLCTATNTWTAQGGGSLAVSGGPCAADQIAVYGAGATTITCIPTTGTQQATIDANGNGVMTSLSTLDPGEGNRGSVFFVNTVDPTAPASGKAILYLKGSTTNDGQLYARNVTNGIVRYLNTFGGSYGDLNCVGGTCTFSGPTVGEANTTAADGGELSVLATTAKVGVVLHFKTFAALDFDLTGNVISIDRARIADLSTAQSLLKKVIDGGDGTSSTQRTSNSNTIQTRRVTGDAGNECNTLIDGLPGEQCIEMDDGKTWNCIASDGLCNTPGEWVRVDATSGSALLAYEKIETFVDYNGPGDPHVRGNGAAHDEGPLIAATDADPETSSSASGVYYFNTGTDAGGDSMGGALFVSATNQFAFEPRKLQEFVARVQPRTTTTHRLLVGGIETSSSLDLTTKTYGIYFWCSPSLDLNDDGASGTSTDLNWWAVTDNNVTDGICVINGAGACTPSANRTATNTTVACNTDSYQKLSITWDGTSAIFKIDGTTRATHTTNIPAAGSRLFGWVSWDEATTAATAHEQRIDYVYYRGAR